MSELVEKLGSTIAGRSQPNHFTRTAWNAVWVVLVSLLAYYALFRLPFRFPPQRRLWSASYAFGFNNSVAILALAGLLGLVTVLYLVRGRRSEWPTIDFSFEQNASGRRGLITALAAMVFLYFGLTFALYIHNARTASLLMWETRHFLHRARLMELYGLRPYSDFSAEYGPLLTSTPVYLHWLLKPLGASLEQAYFASHFLLNVAGLCCIYYLLSCLKIPPIARIVAFVVLAIAGFAPYMGLNGVLLRYFAPFACLVLGYRRFARTLSLTRTRRWWLDAVFTVLLLAALNVLLAPEAAVVFALAWLGYGVLMIRRDARILTASVVAFIITGLLCWLLLPAPYYGSLLRFSEGANNLPLLPVPHLLFYILTLFLVVPPLLAASVRNLAHGVSDVAICGALGLLCVAMAPGAMGRCDPPHVLFYGMGASLLLMVQLANISRGAFAIYTLAYAAVFIGLMQVVNLQVFYKVEPRRLLSRHAIRYLIGHRHAANGTERPSMATLARLDQYPRLGLPFATLGDPAVETYVLSRGQLQPEYYISIVGVYTAAALEQKLRDVARTEYLLVPQNLAAYSPRNPCADDLAKLQKWFLSSANLPCRADPLDPFTDLSLFIADHYTPVEKIGSWVVLHRITNSSMAGLISQADNCEKPISADSSQYSGEAKAPRFIAEDKLKPVGRVPLAARSVENDAMEPAKVN